jgi:hypothetical protein
MLTASCLANCLGKTRSCHLELGEEPEDRPGSQTPVPIDYRTGYPDLAFHHQDVH